jgi:DNA-binding transcriptional MerR regulator
MNYLTIGKMAKINRISEQTLRLYDRMGLLKPYYINQENGYRYYDIKQCAIIDMIQYMKELGMPLKEIKIQLGKKDLSLLKNMLIQQTSNIDDQINELKYQRMAVQRTIESLEYYEKSPPPGTITIEYISKRNMYSHDTGVNFYEYGIEIYEELLRKFKTKMISDSLPQIFFCNAGTIMKKENLYERKFQSSEIFVQLDKNFVANNIKTIPENLYLCIYGDSFDKEISLANKLLDEIEEKKYEIVGDYICEVVAELPLFENSQRGMYIKLQIPIKIK